MVGNARRGQGLKRRSRTRIRASRLVRRVRLRHTINAVNRTREMRYLMRMGVSGILTDFPAVLRRLLHRQIYQDARRAARSARQQARRAP